LTKDALLIDYAPLESSPLPGSAMQSTRRRRVIINSDAKNEADDQYAIVHALLSPSLDMRGLVAAHFGHSRSSTSMADSRKEIDLLLHLTEMQGQVPVANGAPDIITPRLEARP
jgi:purine nucleosidase